MLQNGESPGEVKEHVLYVPTSRKLKRFKEELIEELTSESQSGLFLQRPLIKGRD